MKKIKKLWYVLILALLVALPLLSACAPTGEVPPETQKPEEFILNIAADVSGTYGAVMHQLVPGLYDAVTWLNREHGGIDGVPIKAVLYDTKNVRENTMSWYMKVREEKPPFVEIGQIADCEMLKDRAGEDKIMLFSFMASDRALWEPGYYFTPSLAGTDETAFVMKWISEQWEKSGESRKCRLGMLHADYPLGHCYNDPTIHEYIESLGNMEVVDVEFCDPAATDVSTELTRLSAYNPDWIFCSNLYGLFAATLKGAAALGMLDKVKIATATWNMDPIQTKLCGKELVEGIVGAEPYWQWSDDSPAMRTIKAEFERNNRTEEDIGYFYWHVFSHVCCSIKIAQQVIDKYGWEGFTGPHMLEVIESTESIDGYGIQTITLSGKKHSCRQARMYQFKNGEIVAIGDWGVTPDLRPAEYRK